MEILIKVEVPTTKRTITTTIRITINTMRIEEIEVVKDTTIIIEVEVKGIAIEEATAKEEEQVEEEVVIIKMTSSKINLNRRRILLKLKQLLKL